MKQNNLFLMSRPSAVKEHKKSSPIIWGLIDDLL